MMTGAELRARREALGLTQDLMHDEMMDILGQPRSRFGASIMSRWETERVKMPVWMPLVVRIVEQS
jgi:transcriptional regulator with XRE-family HTH domain